MPENPINDMSNLASINYSHKPYDELFSFQTRWIFAIIYPILNYWTWPGHRIEIELAPHAALLELIRVIYWYILLISFQIHDDVIKWKHFPRYWPFVRGIHRSPVNSPHKGQWRGALMFSLICVWIICWVNNLETGHLRRYGAHYDIIVMNQVRDKWPPFHRWYFQLIFSK